MESNFIYHNAFWPKVMTCSNCGKTARPRHIDLEPPNPDKVFCPFCFEEVPLETYKKDERTMKFVLNGCDISFIAEAPEDITLKQLIEQTDKIFPDWCACGICSLDRDGWVTEPKTEIYIDYDSVRKADDNVSCRIIETWKEWRDQNGIHSSL